MQDESPIEAEQRRRQEALDQATADRYLAMLEADQGPVFKAIIEKNDERAETDGNPEKVRKALYEQTLSPEELLEDFIPRVGGWTPGKHRPETHEGLLFEIEAERALFLGKGAPKDPDPDLQALHQELHQLHVAYQRTGDRSLLLPIADLTARYNALLPKPAPRMTKPKRPGFIPFNDM